MIEDVRQLDSPTSESKEDSSQTDVTSIARRVIRAAGLAVMMHSSLEDDAHSFSFSSGKEGEN